MLTMTTLRRLYTTDAPLTVTGVLMAAALVPAPAGLWLDHRGNTCAPRVPQAGEVRGVDRDLHADPGVDIHLSPRVGPDAPHRRLGDRRHSDRRGRRRLRPALARDN